MSQSAAELHDLGELIAKAPGSSPDQSRTLTETIAQRLIHMRANAIRAFNQLGHLADDEQELEPSDPPKLGSKAYTPPEAQSSP